MRHYHPARPRRRFVDAQNGVPLNHVVMITSDGGEVKSFNSERSASIPLDSRRSRFI
jgi:hypothetical protein